MSRKWLRLISMIAVIMLLMSAVIGCADTNPTPAGAVEEDSGTKTEDAGQEAEEGEAGSMEDPVANEFPATPIVKEGGDVTLTIGVKQNANVTDYYNNAFTRFVEERTGVKIEFVFFSATDAESKLDLMVSSGEELPDVLMFGIDDDTRRLNYGESGVLVDTEAYYEKYGDMIRKYCESTGKDYDSILNGVRSTDGHIYCSAIYLDDNYANKNSLRAFINKTWLDTLGLSIPTTSDELYDVLVAFRDGDPNGNGEADEIPMMGCDNWWQSQPLGYLQNMFIYYNNSETYLLPLSETGGKLDVAYDKDEYRDFLIYANKLVSENLLSTLSFTQDSTQFVSFMLNKPANVGLFVAGPASNLYWGNTDDEYVPFEVCAGPKGVQYQTLLTNDPIVAAAITADCEHPEIAWLVSNYFYYCFAGGDEDSMDVHIRSHWGEKGIDWNYPEPGTTGMFSEFGFDAGLEVINKVWGLPTDKQWQNSSFVIVYAPDIMEVWDGNVDNDEYQYAVNYGYNHDHAPDEADLVPKLHYTAEEVDQWNEPRTALKTYISESRTLFAVGQMDPNNDTDWQNYLSELEKLQYKEILAVDQEA